MGLFPEKFTLDVPSWGKITNTLKSSRLLQFKDWLQFLYILCLFTLNILIESLKARMFQKPRNAYLYSHLSKKALNSMGILIQLIHNHQPINIFGIRTTLGREQPKHQHFVSLKTCPNLNLAVLNQIVLQCLCRLFYLVLLGFLLIRMI